MSQTILFMLREYGEYGDTIHISVSANRFLLLGSRNAARLFLGFGFWQQAKACLAPCEVDSHIEQGVGASAGAGKFHDVDNAVRLSGAQRHRLSRHMVWRGVDAENQIATADSVTHSLPSILFAARLPQSRTRGLTLRHKCSYFVLICISRAAPGNAPRQTGELRLL
jgi:hypothetical protein